VRRSSWMSHGGRFGAASLQLVRAGLAIWKRDRLLPIDRQPECGLAL
jgi:hypothetical protein